MKKKICLTLSQKDYERIASLSRELEVSSQQVIRNCIALCLVAMNEKNAIPQDKLADLLRVFLKND